MILAKVKPKPKRRMWTIRLEWTGEIVGPVRAPTASQAERIAAARIAKQGLGPYELVVEPQYVDQRGMPISAKFLEALHEAAHVICARELGLNVFYVTLIDEHADGHGGLCQLHAPRWLLRYLRPGRGKRRPLPTRGHEQRNRARRELLKRYLVQSLAGCLAEEGVVPDCPHAKSWSMVPGSDSQHAVIFARLLGFRDVHADSVVITSMRAEANKILKAHWPEVVALARELEARWVRRRIGPWDIDRIVRTARRSREGLAYYAEQGKSP